MNSPVPPNGQFAPSVYGFSQQLAVGLAGEHLLDRWLIRSHDLWPATAEQERRGIDRIARHRLSKARYTLQYKTDTKAEATGNAFIETISVDRGRQGGRQAQGWALTCEADYLIYLVLGVNLAYLMTTSVLRNALSDWAQYPTRVCRNKGYNTHGLLVPLTKLAGISKATFEID